MYDTLSFWHPINLFSVHLRGSVAFEKRSDRVPEYIPEVHTCVLSTLTPYSP